VVAISERLLFGVRDPFQHHPFKTRAHRFVLKLHATELYVNAESVAIAAIFFGACE